jgi:hypothetical protein
MVHETGNIEQISIEPLPIGVAPGSGLEFPVSAKTELGPPFKFGSGKSAEGFKKQDRVKVIPHQLKRGQTATVEFQIALEEGDKLAGDPAFAKGKVFRVTGDAVIEVIESRFLALESG